MQATPTVAWQLHPGRTPLSMKRLRIKGQKRRASSLHVNMTFSPTWSLSCSFLLQTAFLHSALPASHMRSVCRMVRYISGEGNGNLPQYSCLEHPMDRGVQRATVMGSQRVRHDSATKQQQCTVIFTCSHVFLICLTK